VSGTGSYIELTRFTNLPIGVYILTGTSFLNNSSPSANFQFGLSATTQNAGLNNMGLVNSPTAGVFLTTQLWIQTSVANVYFSAVGLNNYQGIQATYVRID